MSPGSTTTIFTAGYGVSPDTTNKVCFIVRHTGGLRLLLSQPQSLGSTGSSDATDLRT
jgi:hypothetical protein